MRRKTLWRRHHSASRQYPVKVMHVCGRMRGEGGVKTSLVKANFRQITRSVWN